MGILVHVSPGLTRTCPLSPPQELGTHPTGRRRSPRAPVPPARRPEVRRKQRASSVWALNLGPEAPESLMKGPMFTEDGL